MLQISRSWYTRTVREAIHRRLHPNNINRDSGINIPEAWIPTIKQQNSRFTLMNWIPSFLGIPRNSQKFPTMQISSDLKSLELLGISGKRRRQFCEDLEFLGIPRNSKKFPTIFQFSNLIPSFLEISRNSQKFPTIQISSNLKSLKLLGIFGKGRL